MELLFFASPLRHLFRDKWQRLFGSLSQNQIPLQGERGDIILPFLLCLLTGSLLFSSLFWLNQRYELKTKETLHDFQNRWNHLEEKYQD